MIMYALSVVSDPLLRGAASMHRHSIRQAGLGLAMGVNLVLVAAAFGWTQTPSEPSPAQSKADPKINEPFKRPDVKAYVKKFESEDRETYVRRNEIVAALELSPGMTVADIGAGTGLFTRLFAEKVGATGKVYAVDVSPQFLAHIAAEAKSRGRKHVVTVQGSQNTTNLPRDSVDLVFLSDVYHHLEQPQKILASIRQALRPGGKLVVIEFDRVEGQSSDFVLKHVRAGQAVFVKEIETAGFRRTKAEKPLTLKENFFASFEIARTGGRKEAGARRKGTDRE
jgi:ubiquinone/menaquinone biosynthesis C-methylase UbiE